MLLQTISFDQTDKNVCAPTPPPKHLYDNGTPRGSGQPLTRETTVKGLGTRLTVNRLSYLFPFLTCNGVDQGNLRLSVHRFSYHHGHGILRVLIV